MHVAVEQEDGTVGHDRVEILFAWCTPGELRHRPPAAGDPRGARVSSGVFGDDAQAAFFGDQPEINNHALIAFTDLDGHRTGQDAFANTFMDQAFQPFGQPGVTAGRGQHGVAGSVLRLAVTAGKIVRPGPGRRGGACRAEVIAAGVIDVPVQMR